MQLANRDDYEFPNIDWHCKTCGEVYCSAGVPPDTRCLNGHGAGWKPEDDKMEEYIDFLESLDPGQGLVVCGEGMAPLMGPIASIGDGQLTTESIDSPARVIRWDRDELTISWDEADDEYQTFVDDVYHVERGPPACYKCGNPVELDWWEDTDFPEPLCAACSHMQMDIDEDGGALH